MTVLRSILIGLLLGTLVIGVRADPGPGGGGGSSGGGHRDREKRNPRSNDGAYDILISGYYSGQGTASVSRTSVTITAQVKSEGGETVTLQSEDLPVTGQFFVGKGTLGGQKMTIKGKLDAVGVSRLTAQFKTDTDNHRGLIAGTLPNDPPDDKWDDHGGGAGGGPGPSSDGGGKD